MSLDLWMISRLKGREAGQIEASHAEAAIDVCHNDYSRHQCREQLKRYVAIYFGPSSAWSGVLVGICGVIDKHRHNGGKSEENRRFEELVNVIIDQ